MPKKRKSRRVKNNLYFGMPINLFGDKDRDGVLNVFDCRPRNPRKQGKLVQNIPIAQAKRITLYHGTSKPKNIKKYGLKKRYGMAERIFLTPQKNVASSFADDQAVMKVTLPRNIVEESEYGKKRNFGGAKGLQRTAPPKDLNLDDVYEVVVNQDIEPKHIKQLEDKELRKFKRKAIIEAEV